MQLNDKSHPYLFTYDTNNPENRPTVANTYLWTKREIDYDYWFCQFSDHNSFKIYPIDTLVPADILDRVKNKDAYLVLDNANECFFSSVDGIYQHIVIEKNIPASQIILVSGGYDIAEYVRKLAQQLGQECINVEWFLGQELSVCHQIGVNGKNFVGKTLEKKSYPKKFLNFNRRWRLHRPAMLALLHEKDLIKDGYVSFDKDDFGKSWEETWGSIEHYYRPFTEMYARLVKGYDVRNLLPLYVDTNDLVTNRAFIEDSSDAFYLDTLFSLVSETTYSTQHGADGRFLTEKIFKSIAMAHPFIIIAPPHSLDLLRSLGYKTFEGIIDESYDLELNDGNRMLKIVDEVHRLCNLSDSELDRFLVEARSICEHNYNVLVKKERFIYKTL